VIRKEAWSFYSTISGVRLSWELKEPEEPQTKGVQSFLDKKDIFSKGVVCGP